MQEERPKNYNIVMNFIRARKIAYVNVFNKESVNAQSVLMDLAKFCRATESTFHPDPRVHAQLEGRREVWLRITKNLNLTAEELFNLTTKGTIK